MEGAVQFPSHFSGYYLVKSTGSLQQQRHSRGFLSEEGAHFSIYYHFIDSKVLEEWQKK